MGKRLAAISIHYLALAVLGLIIAVILAAAFDPVRAQEPPAPGGPFAAVELGPGWNLVSGTGETPAALAAREACVATIYGFDVPTQSFTHWFAGAPDYVNAFRPIGTLELGRGYWVYCTPGTVQGAA